MNRYKVLLYEYLNDSSLKTIRAGELSRVDVVDMMNDNQIVVTFPVKHAKVVNKSPEIYGVYINDASLALRMARQICTQMNRESGYAIRGTS